ncbi:MAG TPA: globin family protein [Acidisphaera sp.]|nr:globin family protein [Acidisphaera sp.]
MDDVQKDLVRATFARIAPISDQAGELLYQRMFTIDPSLRALFSIDAAQQGKKLMAVMAMAVANLHRLHEIVPAVRDLGRRHVAYGVKPADYDTGGDALLWTLEQALGADFTPEIRAAWTACYETLTGQMKDAAYGGGAQADPAGHGGLAAAAD